jgi:hypothetical protein
MHARITRATVVPQRLVQHDEGSEGIGYDAPTVGHASTLPMANAEKARLRRRDKNPIGFGSAASTQRGD